MVVLSELTAATQTLHAFTECLRKIPLKDLYSKFVPKRQRRRGSDNLRSAEDKKVNFCLFNIISFLALNLQGDPSGRLLSLITWKQKYIYIVYNTIYENVTFNLISTKASNQPDMSPCKYLQSGAAYHSQGLEDKNLGSSPGLLGQ